MHDAHAKREAPILILLFIHHTNSSHSDKQAKARHCLTETFYAGVIRDVSTFSQVGLGLIVSLDQSTSSARCGNEVKVDAVVHMPNASGG